MTEIASIVLDHQSRSARIASAGLVHWMPSTFYEPLAKLEAKYAAMDSAMRHWHAVFEDAKREAAPDAG